MLCMQAVCSKAARALSWEGGMSSFQCVCACECVCQREIARDRDREVGRRERSHFSSLGLCQNKMSALVFIKVNHHLDSLWLRWDTSTW